MVRSYLGASSVNLQDGRDLPQHVTQMGCVSVYISKGHYSLTRAKYTTQVYTHVPRGRYMSFLL